MVALRDACEQAALEGHWQLPFKQSRLPAPLGSPTKRPGGGAALSPLVSPAGSFVYGQRAGWARSPDPARLGSDGLPLSPDAGGGLGVPGGGGSRPMSPDGLGGGLWSSVFVATGVEGLLVGSPPPDLDLRAIRQAGRPAAGRQRLHRGSWHGMHACCAHACCNVLSFRWLHALQADLLLCLPPCSSCRRQQVPGSPRGSQGALLEGPGHPLLPARPAAGAAAAGVDSQRVSSLQEELGAGEGVSALLLRSSTAGEDGAPGLVQTSEDAPLAGASARSSMDGGSAAAAAAAAQLLSPPSSPRRRQTTFGATLDFVETLCQASSSLTAFQRERGRLVVLRCACCLPAGAVAGRLACMRQEGVPRPRGALACRLPARTGSASCAAIALKRPCQHPPPCAAEDRQWALRRALQQINAEIEKASRNGEARCFPRSGPCAVAGLPWRRACCVGVAACQRRIAATAAAAQQQQRWHRRGC